MRLTDVDESFMNTLKDVLTERKEMTKKDVEKKLKDGEWEAMHDIYTDGKHTEFRNTKTGKRFSVMVRENAFIAKAADAKVKGKSKFALDDKEFPVTIKADTAKSIVKEDVGRMDVKKVAKLLAIAGKVFSKNELEILRGSENISGDVFSCSIVPLSTGFMGMVFKKINMEAKIQMSKDGKYFVIWNVEFMWEHEGGGNNGHRTGVYIVADANTYKNVGTFSTQSEAMPTLKKYGF
jgi:hypothetical protein